jgi:hypothetical protein
MIKINVCPRVELNYHTCNFSSSAIQPLREPPRHFYRLGAYGHEFGEFCDFYVKGRRHTIGQFGKELGHDEIIWSVEDRTAFGEKEIM